MAGEVLTATSSGCPTNLANGSVGEYLGIGANGQPTWLTNPGGPSSDSSNALLTGSDGKAYISCEEIQDCIGTAIAAGLGLTYNDALNAISGALAIPITSGNGAPAATTNSPTVYTDNVTGNVYYRDTTGATVIIGSSTGQTPLTANDSATIDFTASGVNNHTITASVINDPAGGLTATASGEAVKLDPSGSNNLSSSALGLKATAITGSGIQGDGSGINAIRENFDALPAAAAVLPATTTFVVASDGANPNGSQATPAEVATLLAPNYNKQDFHPSTPIASVVNSAALQDLLSAGLVFETEDTDSIILGFGADGRLRAVRRQIQVYAQSVFIVANAGVQTNVDAAVVSSVGTFTVTTAPFSFTAPTTDNYTVTLDIFWQIANVATTGVMIGDLIVNGVVRQRLSHVSVQGSTDPGANDMGASVLALNAGDIITFGARHATNRATLNFQARITIGN